MEQNTGETQLTIYPVRLINLSKLPSGISVYAWFIAVCVCLSCPVMDWRPVRGI